MNRADAKILAEQFADENKGGELEQVVKVVAGCFVGWLYKNEYQIEKYGYSPEEVKEIQQHYVRRGINV